ncbi:hypothetical protein OH76DRAFT_769358 [Lentinus brumalis]|uniref:Uncharacterized protein n=1 Tax=Lentinus brumalis TaxID=2498619 RepID=A0A371D4P6_9APHY|nr:hypothetical protein OH76DRAFT_769358 [Polyporus brumalis]
MESMNAAVLMGGTLLDGLLCSTESSLEALVTSHSLPVSAHGSCIVCDHAEPAVCSSGGHGRPVESVSRSRRVPMGLVAQASDSDSLHAAAPGLLLATISSYTELLRLEPRRLLYPVHCLCHLRTLLNSESDFLL